MTQSAAAARKRPKWHLVYYFLAAFDLLTIASSLYLNHTLIEINRQSIDTNQEWANRLGMLTELSNLAQRTNAPGNDIFDSHDVALERGRRDAAIADFQRLWQTIQKNIDGENGTSNQQRLTQAMSHIRMAMTEMSGEADQIFGFFEKNQFELAGRRMATMDRKYADLTSAIGEAIREVQSIQFELLRNQASDSEALKRFEYWIGAFIGFMVLAVMLYGHKISQVMRRYDDEQLAAKLEAQKANRAKSEFLAKMSHEIRTPMNGVLTTAELLHRSSLAPAQQKLVEIIRKSGAALLTLIDDILDLSKLDAGKLRIEPVDFDLRALIVEATDLFAPAAAKKPVKFAVQLPADPSPIAVHGDALRLRQVILNLISNALKFTATGEICVALAVTGEQDGKLDVEISIRDTGVGLSEEFKSRMFQPFTQAQETAARTHGGTGLGLAIVKQIVDLIGGTIAVESELGKGAKFIVSLSLPKAAEWDESLSQISSSVPVSMALAPAPVTRSPGLPAPARAKVLVAEDNLVNQEVIAAALEDLGYDFTIVEDGAAAVQAEQTGEYALILMDCRMPVLDGFDATRAIRKTEAERGESRRIAILAVSANAMKGDREKCLACGMDDHIAKPFTLAELRSAIERLLPRQHGMDGTQERAVPPAGGRDLSLIDDLALAKLAVLQRPGMPNIVARIVGTYTATAPDILARIKESLARKDTATARDFTHSLISSSTNMGATEFCNACRELELLAGEDKLDQARRKLAEIEAGFPLLKDRLEQLTQPRAAKLSAKA